MVKKRMITTKISNMKQTVFMTATMTMKRLLITKYVVNFVSFFTLIFQLSAIPSLMSLLYSKIHREQYKLEYNNQL